MKSQEFLLKKLHISWLIAVVSAGVLLGITLESKLSGSLFMSYGWLAAAGMLLVLVLWKRFLFLVILAVIAGGLIGLWRGSFERVGLTQYEPLIGKTVTVTGVVSEDVAYSDGDNAKIKLDHITANGHTLNGQVWLSTNARVDIKRSDNVTVTGFMKEGFGNFAASMSRAKIIKVERADHGDDARELRDNFDDKVRTAVKEPQASLGVGFLTGQRSSLPSDLDEELKIVGLTHVVVASGYNLTILVRFARRLFAKISKFLAAASAGGMIVGFMLVTGFSPSMSRAGLVAGLSLLAWYYGRTIHPVVLLSFVAAITALINPFFVWGDIGWYLSFAAFAGVIMLAPLIQSYFWGDQKKPGAIRQIFIDTTSAQLATMPIMAFAFGHYSLYALPANLLVLPFVPFAMLLTFIAGIVAWLIPPLAIIAGWPAQALLTYMTKTVDVTANLPSAQGDLTLSPLLMGCGYALLLLIGFYLRRKTQHKFRTDSLVE